jgi:mRNA interferase MazF
MRKMPSMTGYNFGDILLVPFPFTDQTTTKKRPAVVVSSQAYHQDKPDLLLMAVTSQVSSTRSVGEVPIADWQGAGLIKPSVIKPVITTLEKRLVIRTLGRLNAQDRHALSKTFPTILGE